MQSLKKNWLVLSNMTWGICSNFTLPLKSLKNFTLMGSFCPMYIRFEPKKYRGFIFRDIEQWCKVLINPDLVVSKIAWEIGWTFIRAIKSLTNCTLMGSFCSMHVMFELENSEEVCVMALMGDAEFKRKLTRGLKSDFRNLVSFHASNQKFEKSHVDVLFLSKAYKASA